MAISPPYHSVSSTVCFISLHIRSMWETICDAQAGFCTHSSNSNIFVQILQKAPPPPHENEKLQIWDDQSLLWNTPPPPPENWNLAISWHFEYFQFWHPTSPPPPWKLKFSHFLALWVFSVLAPPWKLKFSHFLALWVFSVLAPPQKGLQSGRSYVETILYPPCIPLVVKVHQESYSILPTRVLDVNYAYNLHNCCRFIVKASRHCHNFFRLLN